jgi:hypothetical protein
VEPRITPARPARARTLALVIAVAGPLVATPAGAAAQPPTRQPAARPVAPAVRQTLSTNPLALPFGTASGEYERAVGRHGLAVGVGGFSTFTRDPETLTDGGSDAYRSLQLKVKYYPREAGLSGLAVGVTAGVAHERELWYGSGSTDASGAFVWRERATRARTAPTVGATLDYNFLLGRRRAFLVGLGVGARRALGVGSATGPLGAVLFDPRLQIGIGF